FSVPQQADQLKAFMAENQKAKQASTSTIQALQTAKLLPEKVQATPEQIATAIGGLVKSRDDLTQTVKNASALINKVNEAAIKAGIKDADLAKGIEDLAV